MQEKLADSFKGVGSFLQLIGLARGNVALFKDGVSINDTAPRLASRITDVAENDPKVAKVLNKLLAVTQWTPVFGVVSELSNDIAKNHGYAFPA